jgi:hypothetical protein
MMLFARRVENALIQKDYTGQMLRSQRFSLSGVTDWPARQSKSPNAAE